ncbi:unnamed protein product [Arctia plantaginis]|uniref:Uncharacterized protein n=1 Tax=Arctia plantaginis TaxID=874455 RepID=A0A8S1BC01_ARCPL|nr:unnamed protein product [Arctia plantaginis]
MVKYILFSDPLRQEEVASFYEICQKHRDYYRGYPKCYHPLLYFREPTIAFQCPSEMTEVYLSYQPFHVRYRQPLVLPNTLERTSYMPQLPDRNLGARYGPTSKAFIR